MVSSQDLNIHHQTHPCPWEVGDQTMVEGAVKLTISFELRIVTTSPAIYINSTYTIYHSQFTYTALLAVLQNSFETNCQYFYFSESIQVFSVACIGIFIEYFEATKNRIIIRKFIATSKRFILTGFEIFYTYCVISQLANEYSASDPDTHKICWAYFGPYLIHCQSITCLNNDVIEL